MAKKDIKPEELDSYVVYTDGSFKKRRFGAWASLVNQCEPVTQKYLLSGCSFDTTNNRMELSGIIVALEQIEKRSYITVYSDSQYAIFCISRWIFMWANNGWLNAFDEPIKNVDLLTRLHKQLIHHNIRAMWVRGHNGNVDNEYVDKIAQGLADLMVEGKIIEDIPCKYERLEDIKELQEEAK